MKKYWSLDCSATENLHQHSKPIAAPQELRRHKTARTLILRMIAIKCQRTKLIDPPVGQYF